MAKQVATAGSMGNDRQSTRHKDGKRSPSHYAGLETHRGRMKYNIRPKGITAAVVEAAAMMLRCEQEARDIRETLSMSAFC